MSERELKLNAIRTVKQSPGLVLEEHGHCEVPAGCGGVVLRWRSRSRFPVQVWIHTLESKAIFLDGEPMTSGRPLVEAGDHVLALRFERIDPAAAVLMAACRLDLRRPRVSNPQPPPEGAFRLLSLPDGTWRFTAEPPPDDSWMRPGFDDASWDAMIARDFPEPAENDWGAIGRMRRIRELGGQSLGIDRPGGPTALLVRRAFRLDPS